MAKDYYVYILSSYSKVLYTGETDDLVRRLNEHKQKLIPGFTAKYQVNRLVYFECCPDIHQAILREKQIKGWSRRKKVELIEKDNPEWKDLSEEWGIG
jgi:putative endonuclease